VTDDQLGLGLRVDDPVVGDVERALHASGQRWAIGVDEVGRGPLAGPVTVAAVAIDLAELGWCDGLNDSKKLSESARLKAARAIRERAQSFCVVDFSPAEVDVMNPLGASLAGMLRSAERVWEELGRPAIRVLVDGKTPVPGAPFSQRCLVKGDARSFAIAAASILAKVHRDALMVAAHGVFPAYGFAQHKGYGTRQHLKALEEHGPCELHRFSYRPVAAAAARHEPIS
jgi:ribonuclease HII